MERVGLFKSSALHGYGEERDCWLLDWLGLDRYHVFFKMDKVVMGSSS
jgi:hypothetical protein